MELLPQPPTAAPPALASAPAPPGLASAPAPPGLASTPAPAQTRAAAASVADPKFSNAEVAELGASSFTPSAPTPLQERALAYMRWRRDDAIDKQGTLYAPSVEMASDVRLWRFLVAESFDAAKAAATYVSAVRWRHDNGLDAIRAALVAALAAVVGTALEKQAVHQ